MSTDTGTSTSPLQTAIADYQTELNKEIKTATSEKLATDKRWSSSKDQLQNKTCSYLKYVAAKELYQSIDQCVAISAHKESELIKSSIETFSAEAKTLSEQLAGLSKSLKAAKTEIYKVKEEACNLVECCLDKDLHEKPEVHSILTYGEITDLDDQLAEIKKQAERSYTIADISFSAIIDVSGIQGFVNIDSLKAYGDDLVATLEALKQDVDENCKALNTSIETSLKERSDILLEVAINKFENYDANCIELGLCETWNQSCDDCGDKKEKPEAGKRRLEEICSKFKDDLEIEDPVPGKKLAKGNKDNAAPIF